MNRLWLAGAGSALIHLLLVAALRGGASAPVPAAIPQAFTPVSIVTFGHAPAGSASGPAPQAPKARLLKRRVVVSPVLEPSASAPELPSEGDSSDPPTSEEGLQVAEASEGDGSSEAAPSQEQRPDSASLVYARLAAVADDCYPAAARRFRQRGTVQISFCVTDEGRVSAAKVVASSGAELLDSAAQDCVLTRAQPFPLSASGQCFALPTRFGRTAQ